MSTASELHSQIASIVEVLANSAVAEICKAVEDGYAVVNLEMSRSVKENECLRRRVRLLELQVSRYRAEQRLKSPGEGATTSRGFPGVRLLRHGRDTPTAAALQNRIRSLNRSSVSQPQHKTPSTDLDQDPDQEVVTTTKTEPTEPEEDSDLVIVKVEGSVSIEHPNVSNSSSAPRTSDSQAQTSCHMEVSGSQTFTKTQDRTLPSSNCQQTEKPDKSMDVIVIDADGSKPQSSNPNSYVDNTWLPLQTPHCSTASSLNEAAGTSSGVQASSVTSVASSDQQTFNFQPNMTFRNQLYHTLNPRQNAAHFSTSANTSQASSQGSFRVRTSSQAYQGMRLLSCSKCPMRFSLEADLIKHVEAHKNRKYVCGLCGKGFVSKSNLEVHQNVHTGEKPFKCNICSSSFTNPSNLRRHMKLQHQLLKK